MNITKYFAIRKIFLHNSKQINDFVDTQKLSLTISLQAGTWLIQKNKGNLDTFGQILVDFEILIGILKG